MKKYKVANDYLYFRDMFSDTMGMNYHVAPIINNKPACHKVLCEVNPYIFGHAEIWKRVRILLEGIKKSNISFLYSPEKIIVNDKQCCLIFDNFKGKNFEQIIGDAEKKGLSINFDLALSICIAIADIIELGSSIIVSGEKSFHGFLTPDNIMVHYDGKISLKNYGIFPYLEKNEILFSELEKRYGSWLTPELIRKEKIVSQSDIYHLGYLIYRILMGKYFSCMPGEDFETKLTNLTFNHMIPSTDKNFLTHLINFLKKTLNPNPMKRFLTIKELKDFIANYFHIEELSSITFNLAYFMNSLYGDEVEEEEKILKQELEYEIPEIKKEPLTTQTATQIKKEDLVSGILDELDKRKRIPNWAWAVVVIVGVIGLSVGFFYFNHSQNTEKITAEKVKSQEQQRQKQQEELAALIKTQNDKIKQLELLAATATEAQKRTLELEKQRLDDLKRRKDEEQAKLKAEAATKKLAEEEQLKNIELEKKAQEELERKKQEEEQRVKLELEKQRLEMTRIKEGDIVALGEVTTKPEKLSGNKPIINELMKKKYSGKVINFQVLILVDENGNVAKIKILAGSIVADIKALLEDTFSKWKYKPALKDDIKVKVWLTIPVKFTF